MKKYFYNDGEEKYGPFSLQELKEKKITRHTFVWYEGLDEWQQAGSILELQNLFRAQTGIGFSDDSVLDELGPATPKGSLYPPKNYLTESILVTLLCCMPFGVAAIVNASKVETAFRTGDYHGAERYANNAKKWVTWGVACGLIFSILYITLIIVSEGDF